MVDIQGLEDFFGDMDFKVAGTKDGITAIQMDLKISGLTPEMIKEALAKTHKARNYILDEVMLKAIPEPRKELSPYAPKMYTTTIPAEKISEVIGKSGKVIKEIQADVKLKLTSKKTAITVRYSYRVLMLTNATEPLRLSRLSLLIRSRAQCTSVR